METTTVTETTNPPEAPPATPAQPTLTGKRANWTIAHEVQGNLIRWSIKGAGTLALDMEKVSARNRERAAVHGMVQRISDAAAMARDSKTGASATPQQKYDAMRRLVEHYLTGSEDWSPARSTEGVGRPRVNPQAELLMAALGIFNPAKDKGTIEQFVKGLNAAQVVALVNSEQLKESVELAREELREKEKQLSAGVNAEELLSGL